MQNIILSVMTAFIVVLITGPLIIPLLKRLKFGQSILEIGPKWHEKKSGTPTMGGIIFMLGVILAVVLWGRNIQGAVLILTSLAFGLIGFIDDFIKVVLKRNMGFTATQKLSAQIIVALIFALYIYNTGLVDSKIYIPFFMGSWDLQWFYIPFIVIVMLATTNSVNLTDGLDGLASSITVVVAVFFTLVAYEFMDLTTAVFMAAITGGCMGFLLFNAHPAKVFMGDTGSLFLGGAICAGAVMLRLPLFLIIVGGIYLMESLSVIIQVTSFKLTRKRIFKMSPIHHHFEIIGWKETKVVTVFVLATVILSIIGFFAIGHHL